MYFHHLTAHLQNLQRELAEKVIAEDCFSRLEKIAGVDVSFTHHN